MLKTYKERTERILEKAKQIKKKRRTAAISITSCALGLILACNLALFVPYQAGGVDISVYKDSEYYPVIESLSTLTYDGSYTTNNYQEWFGSYKKIDYEATAPTAPADYPENDGQSNSAYAEVTNNQTEGVIEGDLFKRSNDYIYYLDYTPADYEVYIDCFGNTEEKIVVYREATLVLNVYSIAGEQSQCVATFAIEPEEGTVFSGYETGREMFLNEDCTTLTVLTPSYHTESKLLYTALISLDVSNPENICETNRVYVSGQYVSSRLINGDFLLISNFTVKSGTDFSDEAQFVPQIGSYGDMTSLPIGSIVLPESATRAGYTVICSLDGETLDAIDSVAFLSYSDEVYVSQNNLFVTRKTVKEYDATEDPFANEEDVRHQLYYTYSTTEIVCVAYRKGSLTPAGSVAVNGTVNDRFSLDEYENVLRVFTTTEFYSSSYTYMTATETNPYSEFLKSSANLYCIDLSAFEVIASVENFAPRGESVKSARFDKDTAYVCTAEVITYGYIIDIDDPVFAFDLSDYNKITYTDTGTIPGYSLSLYKFTDDILLGIGYGDDFQTLKIELYRETGNEVVSIAKLELQNTIFSEQFKAYFIDRINGFIGLGASYYDEQSLSWRNGYLLLHFDGDSLSAEMITLDNAAFDDMRATLIDGYLYIVGHNLFQVVKIG